MKKENKLLAELTVNAETGALLTAMDVMIKFFDEEIEKSNSSDNFKAGYMAAMHVIKTITESHINDKEKRVKELVDLADAADSLVNMLNEKIKKKEENKSDNWQKEFEEFLHGGDDDD